VHDLNGVLLSDQIRDHYFRLQGDKIVEFGIRNNQIKEDNGEQGDAE
jgi:hypothetical protein